LVQQAGEKLHVYEHLKAEQNRRKQQADLKHREVELKTGNFVYLQASPKKGTRWAK
jgi:hypothetical protein